MNARRIISGAVVIGLAAVVAVTAQAVTSSTSRATASSAAQTPATTTPRCTTSDLEVWIGLGTGGAATGSVTYPLEFTNVSSHSCHLYGYPGVSAWSGRQLGSPARRVAGPENTVTLGAGSSGHTLLQITDVSSFPPSKCGQTTATSLQVYPPGAYTAADVPFTFRACSISGPSYLSVQPVQPKIGIPGHA